MKLTLIVLVSLIIPDTCAQKGNRSSIPNRIHEEKFITINGFEQWVTIKGDSTKPVLLFIHGGPGNPLSPFADAIFGNWEKDFVLVQWDQRGSGRTYGRTAPKELTPEYLRANPLTMEQMTSDGIELARYLVQRLHKMKIILFGSSWGSALGVKMVQKQPALFYAFVGGSQIVTPNAADLYAYQKVYELAKYSNDQESLNILNSIGKPPYDTARNLGKFNRIIRKYEAKKSIPPPPSWFDLAPGYNNSKDNQNRADGDDYSFVHYAGDKKIGIVAMSSSINFLNDALSFGIPVYIFQGEEDIQTPAVMTKQYFEKLTAPKKKYITVPNAAHEINQPVVDAQYKVMMQEIIPLVNAN